MIKLLIAMPTRGKIDSRTISWLEGMKIPEEYEVTRIYSSGKWLSNTRNMFIDYAIKHDIDEIMFVSDDVFGDVDTYMRLHELLKKYPIIMNPYLLPDYNDSPYSIRGTHWCVGDLIETDNQLGAKRGDTDLKVGDGIVEASFCSFDCSLWHLDWCLDNLIYPFFPLYIGYKEDVAFYIRQDGLKVHVDMNNPVNHIYEVVLGVKK